MEMGSMKSDEATSSDMLVLRMPQEGVDDGAIDPSVKKYNTPKPRLRTARMCVTNHSGVSLGMVVRRAGGSNDSIYVLCVIGQLALCSINP